MVLTYELTGAGYVIYSDGTPWISQPFDPRLPGYAPFASQDDARAHAEAFIAEHEAAQAASV